MIVLRSTISAALVHAQFVIAGRDAHMAGEQPVFATVAVAVMVVHVVGLFFNVFVVVVVAYLVFRFLPAIVIGMLVVNAMQMARLLKLTVLERSLVILVILVILMGVPVAGVASFEATTIAKKSRPADMLASILTACVMLSTLC